MEEIVKASAKKCRLDDILFPVEIQEETLKSNSEYSKRIVGLIGGENWLLNQCSPRYELIKNESIFPVIENIFDENDVHFSANYQHVNNVRFYADYHINDGGLEYKVPNTNDIIKPMFRVQHSYNGLTKYRIILGYFRLVCTNGLTIPVKEMKEFNLCIAGKHTTNINQSFEQLNRMLKTFVGDAKNVLGQITLKYEMLAGKEVALTDLNSRIEEVLNFTKITAVENSKFNTVNDIVNRINKELTDPALGYTKANDWLIYNGINQYINDNNRNIVAPEIRQETDSKVFEYMLVS